MPVIAGKPGPVTAPLIFRTTTWCAAKTSDIEFQSVGIGERVCVRAVHGDTFRRIGNRRSASRAAQRLPGEDIRLVLQHRARTGSGVRPTTAPSQQPQWRSDGRHGREQLLPCVCRTPYMPAHLYHPIAGRAGEKGADIMRHFIDHALTRLATGPGDVRGND